MGWVSPRRSIIMLVDTYSSRYDEYRDKVGMPVVRQFLSGRRAFDVGQCRCRLSISGGVAISFSSIEAASTLQQ